MNRLTAPSIVFIELDLVDLVLHIRHSPLNVLSPGSFVNAAEQNIDLFQTQSLGLGDEEPHKDAVGQAEDAEHEEGAPADGVDGFGGNFGDNELGQKVRI